jgi:hypothetical protein
MTRRQIARCRQSVGYRSNSLGAFLMLIPAFLVVLALAFAPAFR